MEEEDDDDDKPKPVEKPPKPVNVIPSSIDARYSFLIMGYVYNLEREEEVSLKVLARNLLAAPPIKHGVFSPDNKYVAVASPNGAIYTFIAESGKHMHTFGHEEKKGFSMFGDDERNSLRGRMHILPDYTLICPGHEYETKKELFVFNVETGETRGKLTGQDYSISIVVPSPDSSMVATANSDGGTSSGCPNGKPIIVYDLKTLKTLATVYGCTKSSHWYQVAFCGTESNYLCTSQWSVKGVVIYYIGTKEKPVQNGIGIPCQAIHGHDNIVTFLGFSHMHNGMFLMSGSIDNTVKIWLWERIVAECEKAIERCCDVTDRDSIRERFFNVERDRPNQFGEGQIETTAVAVSV